MNLRLRFGLLLLTIALGTTLCSAQTEQAKRVYQMVEKSVFTIETDKASGTGFVIDYKPPKTYSKTWDKDIQSALAQATGHSFKDASEGTIMLTAFHVIADAKTIEAVSPKGTRYKVTRIYGYSKAKDIAVLYLDEGPGTQGLQFGDYSALSPGDPVYVVGTALGFLENSLTSGIVSGRREVEGLPILQFTAAISHGNSGSPVLTSEGKIVAMATGSLEEGQSLNLGVGCEALIAAVISGTPSTKSFPVDSASSANPGTGTSSNENGKESGGDPNSIEAFTELFEVYNRVCIARLNWEIPIYNFDLDEHSLLNAYKKFYAQSDCSDILDHLVAKYPTLSLKEVAEALIEIMDTSREIRDQLARYYIDARYPDVSDVKASYARVETAHAHFDEAFKHLFKAMASHPAFAKAPDALINENVAFAYHRVGKLACFPDPVFKDSCVVGAPLGDKSFKRNDEIRAIIVDGEETEIHHWRQLSDILGKLKDGKTITVKVYRAGEVVKVMARVSNPT